MVTCILQGRCGNIFWEIAMAYAYALKYDQELQIPKFASHCDGGKIYFNNLPFKINLIMPPIYDEPQVDGHPYFHKIPEFENVTFRGYWQSFKYIDNYREQILEAFNISYNKKEGITSIHVRRGDYVIDSEAFPPLPLEYYVKAIDLIDNKEFLIFSDDIPWCKEKFNNESFPDCVFEFSEGNDELRDLELMSGCVNNIVANSSFSFVASWLNQNPQKKVISPSYKNLFKGHNLNYIPENYIQIEC